MSKRIHITPSEWDIMEALWRQAPLSAAEIFDALPNGIEWNVKTVRSFLDRLVRKRVVRKEKVHGMNVFLPVPKRGACLRGESRSFMDRFFQGNPVSLVSHFLEHEGLSDDDLERLRRLLDGRSSAPSDPGE